MLWLVSFKAFSYSEFGPLIKLIIFFGGSDSVVTQVV